MMIPKLRAIELVDRMKATGLITDDYVYDSTSIECALIAVRLVLENLEDHTGEDTKYWNEVKNEINKLR